MDKQEREEYEFLRQWLVVCDGQASADEEAELFARLASDERLQELVASIAQDQAILDRCLTESVGFAASGKTRPVLADSPRVKAPAAPSRTSWNYSTAFGVGSLAAMLLIGLTIGSWMSGGDAQRMAAGVPESADDRGQRVHVTRISNCVWGAGRRAIDGSNTQLRDGEVVELLEGFALLKIESDEWNAEVQLEGPAAVVLSAEGLPILRYGNMLVDLTASPSSRGITLDLPLSRLHLSAGAKVGVSSLDNRSEVHMLQGYGTLESLWDSSHIDFINASGSVQIAAGESCSIVSSQGVVTQAERGEANPGLFDADGLIRGGNLLVTSAYTSAVKESEPIAYWDFEKLEQGEFRNQVQDKFHLKQTGDIRLKGLPGNRHLDFFVDDVGARYLSTAEAITDDIPGDYAIEFWINPSHFQTATIVAFLTPELPLKTDNRPILASDHGLLVELGGYSGEEDVMRPQKLRFLHRSPSGSTGGTQLFSSRTHAIREWQHVVCTKEQDLMRIYINGEKLGQTRGWRPQEAGLQALVGQMSDGRHERMFFGQLDELAIYDRTLDADEVEAHYRAVATVKGTVSVY
jgi:hypothetical protein